MNTPEKIEVKAGNVAWCTCGLSQNSPYCDGSHKTTDKTPLVENIQKDTHMFICKCGKTQNKPFCDGSHSEAATSE